jgi:hypothetical protein
MTVGVYEGECRVWAVAILSRKRNLVCDFEAYHSEKGNSKILFREQFFIYFQAAELLARVGLKCTK